METIASNARSSARRTPPAYRDLTAVLQGTSAAPMTADDAEAMRARVSAALATFRDAGVGRAQVERLERQHAIIARCDLGGELHKVVAADLNISMRTFYRERAGAFARLASALESIPQRLPVRSSSSDATARTARAWQHVFYGKLREAVVRLEEIVVDAPAAHLPVAYARLAAARWLSGADTADALAHARRALSVLSPGAASADAEAEIVTAEALCSRSDGAFERATHQHERAMRRLEFRATHDPDSARFALLAMLRTLLLRGDGQRALDVARAFPANASGDHVADRAVLEHAVEAAVLEARLLAGDDPEDVRQAALAVYETASGQGAVVIATRALCVCVHAAVALLDRADGLRHARAALSVVRDLGTTRLGASLMLDVADAFAECGDGEGAVTILRRFAVAAGRRDFEAGVVRLREAHAMFAGGDHRDAAERAREALDVLARFQSRRMLGEAALVLAQSRLAYGDVRGARSSGIHAAQLLRGSTWPARVARATRLAGRRTPSPARCA